METTQNTQVQLKKDSLSLDEMIKLVNGMPLKEWHAHEDLGGDICDFTIVHDEKMRIEFGQLGFWSYQIKVMALPSGDILGMQKGKEVKEYFRNFRETYEAFKEQEAIKAHNAIVTQVRAALKPYQQTL
jgi:hypothetical protein